MDVFDVYDADVRRWERLRLDAKTLAIVMGSGLTQSRPGLGQRYYETWVKARRGLPHDLVAALLRWTRVLRPVLFPTDLATLQEAPPSRLRERLCFGCGRGPDLPTETAQHAIADLRALCRQLADKLQVGDGSARTVLALVFVLESGPVDDPVIADLPETDQVGVAVSVTAIVLMRDCRSTLSS